MAGGRGERLFPLTRDKAKPAIVFGARYRIIDFTLSNCLNSGIRRIYVLSQYGSLSLDSTCASPGTSCGPDLGEFVYSVPPQQITVNRWYRGTADSIYQNLNLLEAERPEAGADPLRGSRVPHGLPGHAGFPSRQGRRHDGGRGAVCPGWRPAPSASSMWTPPARSSIFWKNPPTPRPCRDNPDFSLVSMGVYIFNAEVLVQEVIADAKNPDSQHDFGRNIIPQMVGRKKVYAYNFQDQATGAPSYWRDIGRLDAYFDAHRDLLGPKPAFDLFDREWPIRGHVSSTPPAFYNGRSIDGSAIP
jgi:glucose-1-phosphate adenylyltransferase